jgi:hypothetical protein
VIFCTIKLVKKENMAKTKSNLIKFSGKFGDVVHVNSKTHGTYARKAVAAGTNKHQPALKQQYVRTKYINELASQVNAVIDAHAARFKPTKFYWNLLSCLRQEPLDNRFLLLRQLRGMEVDPDFPLRRLGVQKTSVKVLKNTFVVTLDVDKHPDEGRYKANCYSYEVVLATWDKTGKPPKHQLVPSYWVDMNGGHPVIELEFQRPAGVVHWMLCLRQRLGKSGEVITAQRADAMQVVEVGSLDEKDHALLKKREEEAKKEQGKGIAVKEVEVVRVGPKRIKDIRR